MKKKLFLSLLLISSVFYAQEGSLDVTLDPGTGFGARPEKLLNLANDKIFVVGDFQNYKGISAHSMVALNTDGSIDKYIVEDAEGRHRVNARSYLGMLYASAEFAGNMFLVNETEDGKFPSFVYDFMPLSENDGISIHS